jgi:hypothetical protein
MEFAITYWDIFELSSWCGYGVFWRHGDIPMTLYGITVASSWSLLVSWWVVMAPDDVTMTLLCVNTCRGDAI